MSFTPADKRGNFDIASTRSLTRTSKVKALMQTPSDLIAHSAMFSASPQTPSAAGGKKKLIYDQDHRGPISTDTVATLMLLQADNIDLLGICTVSCDMWA